MDRPRDHQNLFAKIRHARARYTSYPTAPHFHEGVDKGVYRDWLASLIYNAALTYFHIPFTFHVLFCSCLSRSRGIRTGEGISDVMLQEIDLVANALPSRMKAGHAQGGGSPTMLNGDDWTIVVQKLGLDSMSIPLGNRGGDGPSHAPLIMWVLAGRRQPVSIGIQDFHPEVQAISAFSLSMSPKSSTAGKTASSKSTWT